MLYLAIFTTFVFYIIHLLYYSRLYPSNRKRVIWTTLIFAGMIITYIMLNDHDKSWMIVLVMIVGLMAALKLGTSMNFLQATHGVHQCAICIFGFRGILTAIYFLLTKTECGPVSNETVLNLINVFAVPVTLLYLYTLRKKLLQDYRMRLFLNNSHLLAPTVAYQILAALTLITLNAGFMFNLQTKWYCTLLLGGCVLSVGTLFYIIIHSIDIIELTENKWSMRLLEKQNELMVRHYKTYERFINNFCVFQHDYRRIMSPLKVLIENGKISDAQALVKEISATMEETIQLHEKFSPDPAVDAVFQEIACQCQKEGIRFQCHRLFSLGTKPSVLDSLRIVTNLSSNAVDACLKVPREERFSGCYLLE